MEDLLTAVMRRAAAASASATRRPPTTDEVLVRSGLGRNVRQNVRNQTRRPAVRTGDIVDGRQVVGFDSRGRPVTTAVTANAPPQRNGQDRFVESFDDTIRHYSPAALAARSLNRSTPLDSGFRRQNENITAREQGRAPRSSEDLLAERRSRVTARENDFRLADSLRESADPANSVVDWTNDLAGGMAGGMISDPTAIIAPGKTLLRQLFGMAAIGGAADAALQGTEIGVEGTREEYSPLQTAISAAAGPVIVGGVRGGARASSLIRENIARRIQERRAARQQAGLSDEFDRTPVYNRQGELPLDNQNFYETRPEGQRFNPRSEEPGVRVGEDGNLEIDINMGRADQPELPFETGIQRPLPFDRNPTAPDQIQSKELFPTERGVEFDIVSINRQAHEMRQIAESSGHRPPEDQLNGLAADVEGLIRSNLAPPHLRDALEETMGILDSLRSHPKPRSEPEIQPRKPRQEPEVEDAPFRVPDEDVTRPGNRVLDSTNNPPAKPATPVSRAEPRNPDMPPKYPRTGSDAELGRYHSEMADYWVYQASKTQNPEIRQDRLNTAQRHDDKAAQYLQRHIGSGGKEPEMPEWRSYFDMTTEEKIAQNLKWVDYFETRSKMEIDPERAAEYRAKADQWRADAEKIRRQAEKRELRNRPPEARASAHSRSIEESNGLVRSMHEAWSEGGYRPNPNHLDSMIDLHEGSLRRGDVPEELRPIVEDTIQRLREMRGEAPEARGNLYDDVYDPAKNELARDLHWEQDWFREHLKEILPKNTHDFVDRLFRMLEPDARIVTGSTMLPEGLGGMYRPLAGDIHIKYADDGYVALHELVHAATIYKVGNNLRHVSPGLKAEAKEIFEQALGRLHNKQGTPEYWYGLNNIDEFMAEIFSNPSFQQRLREVRMPRENVTAWQKVVSWIRRVLGLPEKYETLLDRSLRMGSKVLDESENMPLAPEVAYHREHGTPDRFGDTILPSERSPNEGERRLEFRDADGNPSQKENANAVTWRLDNDRMITARFTRDGDRLIIDDIGVTDRFGNELSDAKNRAGAAEIRTMMGALRQEMPDIRSISGTRVSGASRAAGIGERNVEAPVARPSEGRSPNEGEPRQVSDEPELPLGLPPKEPGPRTGEPAGNVNLNRIVGNDDIDDVLRETAENIRAKNGEESVSHEEVEGLAGDLGLTPERLLSGNEGITPEYAVAARSLLRASAERVVDLARRINAGDLSEGTKEAMARAWAIHGSLQEKVQGITSYAGRLLDSFNVKVGEGRAYENALKNIDELLGSRENIERLSRLIEDHADNPLAVNQITREMARPKASDYVFSAWYNWRLLSSVWTHFRNIAGNTLNQLYDINVDHAGAALLGQFTRLHGNTNRVMLREIIARNIGAVMGIRAAFIKDVYIPGENNALSRIRAAWQLGTPMDFVRRHERPTVYKGKGAQQFAETATRSMAAMDEVFRNVAAMSNFYGAAYRQASQEGLSGSALRQRMFEIVRDPPEQMLRETAEYAKRMRFQDEMGPIAQGFDHMRTPTATTHPALRMGQHLLRTQVPFLRTPSSLFRTALRRTPLGIMEGVNYRDWKAGGPRRHLAVARVAMGSLLLSYFAHLATSGLLTGQGPSDYRRRQELEASGWRANTINGVPYSGLDPISQQLSIIATILERQPELEGKEWDSQAVKLLLGTSDALADTNWTSNLFDLISSQSRQEGTAVSNAIANVISPVPGFARDIQRVDDEFVRDTRGDGSPVDRVQGRIQNEIPETVQNWLGLTPLPIRNDVYGRPVKRPDTPFSPVERSSDPVVLELQRLAEGHPRALVGPPGINIGPMRRRLEAHEFQAYQMLSGTYLLEDMKELMADPEWQQMTLPEQREEVRRALNAARRDAREDLFGEEIENQRAIAEGEDVEEAPAPDTPTAELTAEVPHSDETEGEAFVFGRLTSGRRTEAGNAAVDGEPDSAHLSGEALDFIPAQGQSMAELTRQAREFFGPDAYVLNEGDHVHVRIRGLDAPYYGARGTQ